MQSKLGELQFELAESKEQLSAMTETNDQLSSDMADMQAELEKVQNMCTVVYTHTHTHTHACMHAYIHTYIHTYHLSIHPYIHTY